MGLEHSIPGKIPSRQLRRGTLPFAKELRANQIGQEYTDYAADHLVESVPHKGVTIRA